MSVRVLLPSAKEGELSVEDARLHYLSRVLRVREGDSLEVFDGEGGAFDAKVTALEPERATLLLGPRREAPKPRKITIVQGLPKADKLELVLQKGTELGASEFIPAAMARSIVKLEKDRADKKVERWQRICEEAARQCGRSDVPLVRAPSSLEDALRALPEGTATFVLDEEERERGLQSAALELRPDQPVALIIGPEGGVDRTEVQWLKTRGAQTVTLGRRVLRTETAALVALSVLQLLDGELGS